MEAIDTRHSGQLGGEIGDAIALGICQDKALRYLLPMIIEQLTFRVPVALRPLYLALDAEIWTATLAGQPGFIGKETWVEAEDPEALHLIIRWQTRSDWKAVPATILAETDRRFAAALGQHIPVQRCLDQDVLG